MTTPSSTTTTPPVLSSSQPQPTVRIPCTSCSKLIEFLPPSPSHPELVSASWTSIRDTGSIGVKCWNCSSIITVDLNGQPISTSDANDKLRSKIKLGSDLNPIDTEYYDELGVSPTATAADIKKAYYQLAMKYHPDKNGGDVSAADRFKRISEAYQVLSDPKLRKQYNEFGKQNGPEGGFADPSTFFKAQFGGDRFADIIGDISIAHDFQYFMDVDNESLSKDERDKREKTMLEEKQRIREERVTHLVEKLIHKLSILTETPMDERSTLAFEQICKLEADELKNESYGVELLHATGYTYTIKAKQFLSSNSIGSMWHSMTEKTHVVSETMSTFKSAINLQRTFTQLNEAKQKGNLTDEQWAKLEEAATEVGFETLWKGSKLEVQSVLREVCDRVLHDRSLSKDQLRKRATALKILGQTYESVKGENNTGPFIKPAKSSSSSST